MVMQESKNVVMELHRFLLGRGLHVSTQTKVRVVRLVESRLHQTKLITFQDVSAIGLLSVSLRSQFLYELANPHVMTHPFFEACAGMDKIMVQEVCYKVIS